MRYAEAGAEDLENKYDDDEQLFVGFTLDAAGVQYLAYREDGERLELRQV